MSLKFICKLIILNLFTFAVLVRAKEAEVVVPEVNEETLDQLIKSPVKALVMFYAPWCQYCQTAKPEMFKLASNISQSKLKLKIAFVNCEESKNTDMCAKQKINGYPTIKLFHNHTENLFENEVTVDNLLYFVNNPNDNQDTSSHDKVTNYKARHVVYLNTQNFEDAIKIWNHVLVLYSATWCTHCQQSLKEVDETAKQLKESKNMIFIVECEDEKAKELCKKASVSAFPTVIYYKSGKRIAEYNDELTKEAFLEFFKTPNADKSVQEESDSEKKVMEQFTEVHVLDAESFNRIVRSQEDRQDVVVMFMTPSCPHCQTAVPEYNEAAYLINKQMKENPQIGSYLLTAINCEGQFQHICETEKVDAYPTYIHYRNGQRVQEYNDLPLSKVKLVKYLTTKINKDEL